MYQNCANIMFFCSRCPTTCVNVKLAISAHLPAVSQRNNNKLVQKLITLYWKHPALNYLISTEINYTVLEAPSAKLIRRSFYIGENKEAAVLAQLSFPMVLINRLMRPSNEIR